MDGSVVSRWPTDLMVSGSIPWPKGGANVVDWGGRIHPTFLRLVYIPKLNDIKNVRYTL